MGVKPSVVFLCVENSCRSQLAEGLARQIAGDRFEIYSAGSKPSGQVNPKAIASLAEVGISADQHVSKGLDALPDLQFKAAITMGCGDNCPNLQAQLREDWGIPDPKHLPSEEFRYIRETIRQKIEDLFARLSSEEYV